MSLSGELHFRISLSANSSSNAQARDSEISDVSLTTRNVIGTTSQEFR